MTVTTPEESCALDEVWEVPWEVLATDAATGEVEAIMAAMTVVSVEVLAGEMGAAIMTTPEEDNDGEEEIKGLDAEAVAEICSAWLLAGVPGELEVVTTTMTVEDDDGKEDADPGAEAIADVCPAWLLAGMPWELEVATTIMTV